MGKCNDRAAKIQDGFLIFFQKMESLEQIVVRKNRTGAAFLFNKMGKCDLDTSKMISMDVARLALDIVELDDVDAFDAFCGLNIIQDKKKFYCTMLAECLNSGNSEKLIKRLNPLIFEVLNTSYSQ